LLTLPEETKEKRMNQVAGDRRRNRRYEMRLPLHYRVSVKGEPARSGSGMTMDMSTTGMSFRSRKPLPIGAHVEVVVDWPAKYADVYPIDLQVTGFVVRSDAGRTAVRMTSRKFRVASVPAEPIRATA
jgi:c-di-GMP-binding flagellar brake protein YcgR